MKRVVALLALCFAINSCAAALKPLTPRPTKVVHPDADWENAEDEAEMDPFIPAFNPLMSKDPTEQLLSPFRGTDRKGPKTSIASGAIQTFVTIEALIASLPDDDDMINHQNPALERHTDVRLTEEALKEGKLVVHLTVARDGLEATDILHQRNGHANAKRPDLILLDLNLPKIDGRQVLQEIKNAQAVAYPGGGSHHLRSRLGYFDDLRLPFQLLHHQAGRHG